jgi:UDP-N-acetylmuramoylalanine--D-glutamate ligase
MELGGKRATVMGLGRFGGGVAAARWLAEQGALVTVTDLAGEGELAQSLAALDGVPIEQFRLGGHSEDDFRRADLVVVNPAVRPGNPLVEIARRAGARLTSELELFLEDCPAPVVGVTGSNGKSTTAAMTAAILRAEGRRAWLGGNIGRSLLGHLAEIRPGDWVVLEISSFQLHWLGPHAPGARVAVVTGCSPNHLDWHGSWPTYLAAKQRLLSGQPAHGVAVLNSHDREVATWAGLVRGRPGPLPELEDLPPLRVPGEHNRVDAALAAGAAGAAGCSDAAVVQGLEAFGGLPMRLEWFAVIEGRRFYNDSTSTTPESTAAALEAIDEPVWLMAGGREKGCAMERLTSAAAARARGAAFFGQSGEMLRADVARRNAGLPCTAVETLADALRWCWDRSKPGEAIVLSPGCASGDQFPNFRRRGEHFAELVRAMADPLRREALSENP